MSSVHSVSPLRPERRPESPTATAARYARALLRAVGRDPGCARFGDALPPALDWAASGAMALTGRPAGPPLAARAPVATAARAALQALALVAERDLDDLDAPALLGERAAALGLGRRGDVSAGGSCRLLRAPDGWIALNLPRADDRALVPAWLGDGDAGCAGSSVPPRLAHLRVRDAVARARLLGLAVAPVAPLPAAPVRWLRVAGRGPVAPARRRDGPPLVVDLSALWAGPLCTQLLQRLGARVVKVESVARPDGARRGPARFFDLMNEGKESVALDFTSAAGRRSLAALLERADVVVESARPRALRQLGFQAESWVRARPGRIWLALSAYGRREPGAAWVGFGDDTAAAAGLCRASRDGPGPLFCADAVADPLAGLHAALAVWAAHCAGGGRLLDVSLYAVARHVAGWRAPGGELRCTRGGFEVAVAGAGPVPVAPPRMRRPAARAAPLGGDTRRVLRELGAC